MSASYFSPYYQKGIDAFCFICGEPLPPLTEDEATYVFVKIKVRDENGIEQESEERVCGYC